MHKRLTPAGITLLYAAFAGLWILASDRFLTLAITNPEWMIWISISKGVAFVIVTASLLYLLLKSRDPDAVRSHAAELPETAIPRPYKLIASFLCLAFIVPLFGLGIAKIYGPRILQASFNDLSAVAELKSGQIETWLRERLADANELAERVTVIEIAERWLKNRDAKTKALMLSRMDTLARAHDYEPVLLDAEGRRALTLDGAPEDSVADEMWQELLALAAGSGEIRRSDLYRDDAGKVRLDYVVPLHLDDPHRLVGGIVLRAPAEQFLFPLIQSWPTSSPSAETVLTRRDGAHVLFLNDLRHRKGTALSLRLPLDDALPAAVSIRSEQPRTMEGRDYRGVQVLAATRSIPGTDWHMVAKVDHDEVMAPLGEALFWASLLAIIAVAVVATAVLLLWRQQQRLHGMELLARTAEKDKQLKLFYDLSFIGMAISSPTDKAWLYANDCLCDMLGYTHAELLQTTWAQLTHPDDLAANLQQFERMKAGELDGYELEKRFVRKDGTPINVNLNVKCTRGADGQINLIVAMIEDITERKRTEQALRESEDRFRNIFTNAIDGVLIADMSTRKFVMGNPAIAHMLGYSSEELLGLGVEDIHPAEALPGIRTEFDEQATGKRKLVPELPVKRKDGTVFYADINVSPVVMEGKQYLMGVFRDITERKRTEDALRQGATVFESSHDGAIITDLSGNVLAANRAYLEITGYSEAEVLGRNPRMLHSGRHSRDFYQSMWASVAEAGYWMGEVWNRRKNGEIYPVQLTISAVKNDQGVTTNYVGISSDLSLIKQSQTQLEHLAHYDPLTDLPNRLLVQSHLSHTLAQAQRHHRQVGVLYIDLDRFKNINDSLGYPVGDELLLALVKRLSTRMRGEDMLARLNGDEFLLVLEYIESPEDAAGVARSLLELLTQPFMLGQKQEVFIGASIGISVFPNDGNQSEQLIQHADAAMHQAKKQGRNTYRFYIDSLTQAAGEHLELETRLRHAITTNQLRVYYQPQVDIATGHVIGAEALVRWQDPERGLIPPAQFIPLAEETGLIGAIGEWVLQETCSQGARWIKAGLPFLTLAVNLSSHQFTHGDISEQVSKVLAETGFPASRLELELTESALMEQEEQAVKILHLLRAQNIRLAIDDFGTGYSSLSYLKRFPLDVLKIDKSFVDDIPFHKDDMEIAATIIAMGHTLGFKVLAEGVETLEQLAFLQSKGCDMYQGYLTSPPVPAEKFEALWARKI